MALSSLLGVDTLPFSVAVVGLLIFASLFRYLFHKPAFPKNAPSLDREYSPILGAYQFFKDRWDFYQRAMSRSKSGNFSFYAGQWPVIGLSGDEERKIFFENKGLSLAKGYQALFAGSPEVRESNNPFIDGGHDEESGFSAYFNKRIINMLKGNRLAQGLPLILSDAREMLDDLAAEPTHITNPFVSVYKMVYRFTMRTVACNEIASDQALLDETLALYEAVEDSVTPLSIMFPWVPTWAKFQKVYAGAKLYRIFKRVVDDREKEGRRENDALQYLIDEGDSTTDMITFVMGALFAGQLNSGVNAAWVLVYLANKPHWLARAKEEVESVAKRYAPDESIPLKDRLMKVPCEAFETEFPFCDACLKDSIRLQMSGAAIRQNVSGFDIPINKSGTEVLPKDMYVAYAPGDVHYNPAIYTNPEEWDPERYLPERAEDKKREHAFLGWGVGRHPCLGMRFAKLEMNIIIAFFLAYFEEIRVCERDGKVTGKLPVVDRNQHHASRPEEPVYLKYKVR